MLVRLSSLVAALAFSGLVSGAAFALAAAPPTPVPAGDAAAREAKSAECYKQADAKTLHGKERRMFHHECMKAK